MCPLCEDTGWKTIEVDGVLRVTRCECVLRSAADRRLAAAGIPDKYKKCTFDSFETHYDSLRIAAAKAKRFVDEFPAFPTVRRGLIFLGSFGVGKTHLAVATLKASIVKGATGYFCEVADLLKRVRDTYDSSRENDELDVLRPVLHSDVLLLDDLGEERTSQWVHEALAHVVNVRYSENRATIFTTNLEDSPDSTNPRSFIHKVGGRTRSRLIEMCEWVHMAGIDTREVGPEPTPEKIAEWHHKSPLSPENLRKTRKVADSDGVDRTGKFPERSGGQLKAKPKPRFGESNRELKWPGGKAGS